MISIGNCLSCCLFFHLLFTLSAKNYQFEVTYECEENEYEQILEQLNHQEVYGCKNWVQKILIRQQKNQYLRYQSAQKQQQEEIEEQQQEDFQQQEQKQEQKQKEEKKQQQQQMLEKILQQLEQQKAEKEQMAEKQQRQESQTTTTASMQVSNKQTQTYLQNDKQSASQSQEGQGDQEIQQENGQDIKEQSLNSEKIHHYNDPINKNDHSLQQKVSNIHTTTKKIDHHSISRHYMSPIYSSTSSPNQIRHYFEFRKHNEEQQQQEEQKHKPLKWHRSHPIDDVLFLLDLVQMNCVILESTFKINKDDLPSIEEFLNHPISKDQSSAQEYQTDQKNVERQFEQHKKHKISKSYSIV